MNKHKQTIIVFFLAALSYSLSAGCSQQAENSQTNTTDTVTSKEHLIEANKILVEKEAKDIDTFIVRRKFNMEKTGTGLRYQVYKHGEGEGKMPALHDVVTVTYKMYLLDGTVSTTVDSIKPQSFRLGEGKMVRGLEEGIMLMHEGDQYIFVVPSYLGYGMQGNGDNIPGATPIFVTLHLRKVNP